MPAYPGTTYVYLSIDASGDVGGRQLHVGHALDELPVLAEPVLQPSADLLATSPRPRPGRSRYWWRVFAGEGQPVPLVAGANTLYGRLDNTPESQPHAWRFTLTI